MNIFSHYNDQTFKIEEDLTGVGFYVYVYDKQGRCTHDYLQDTEVIAKEFALEYFGVPLDSWIEA